jgi:hypothetical protein
MWAMPEATVQKMIGAMTILMSLMKPSPSAFTTGSRQSMAPASQAGRPARWQ